jgi:hypothetical protein
MNRRSSEKSELRTHCGSSETRNAGPENTTRVCISKMELRPYLYATVPEKGTILLDNHQEHMSYEQGNNSLSERLLCNDTD